MVPGLVSVMMPAFNAERFIAPAVESLLAQTYPGWELVVVNDGSTDKTASIARGFGDPRIRVLDQVNGGEGSARNTALGQIRGEYLAFLDADDVFLPQHLELAVEHLREHPDHGGTYSDGYYIDETGKRLQTLSSRRFAPAEGRIFEQVALASCMLGPPVCVLLRSEIVKAHRLLFDPSLPLGTDWDFFTRYADVATFGYIDRKTCLYRLHQKNVSTECSVAQRADCLAKSRLNAVALPGFDECSATTRAAVFYDLLVNLLRGHPEQQSLATRSPQFLALPASEQGRILRLMASKTIIYEADLREVLTWLRLSQSLDPSNRYARLLLMVYRISPHLCRFMLRARTVGQPDERRRAPFGDLKWRNRQ